MTSSFVISGVVPIILHASILQLSPTTFQIEERSNSPMGYKVEVYTDAVDEGHFTFTSQGHQERSINIKKLLVLPKIPSFVQVMISAEE